MAGLHIADRSKTKLGAAVFTLREYGRQYEPDMVAGV